MSTVTNEKYPGCDVYTLELYIFFDQLLAYVIYASILLLMMPNTQMANVLHLLQYLKTRKSIGQHHLAMPVTKYLRSFFALTVREIH